MSDRPRTVTFPRRDALGRVQGLPDLLGAALLWLVAGVVALLLIDGIFTLLGGGSFGRGSGWIAGILVVWLYAEEYRAWRPVRLRAVVAAVGALLGFGAGLLTSGAVAALHPLVAGTLGVAVASAVYALIWYAGVRWAADRFGDE